MKIKCKIKECNKPKKTKGVCGMHDQRMRRYGDYNYVTTELERRKRSRNAQPKLGVLKPQTYKKLLGRHEHRVLMELHLGRKLVKGEIVHHIDGNKHNNDLSNLKLMTQSEHIKSHIEEIQKIRAEKIALRGGKLKK